MTVICMHIMKFIFLNKKPSDISGHETMVMKQWCALYVSLYSYDYLITKVYMAILSQ